MARNHKTGPADPTRSFVAAALNIHGFLFQQRLEREIQKGSEESRHGWVLEASEYPVTAAGGKETRIDIILALQRERGVKVAIECKRANPRQNVWMFWGTESTTHEAPRPSLHLEVGERNGRGGSPGAAWKHRLIQLPPADFPVCHYFIDADSDDPHDRERGGWIDRAIGQAMFGQSGLFQKLQDYNESDIFCAIPLIATTARLLQLDFDVDDVDLSSGRLSPDAVACRDVPAVAVNYAGNNHMALFGEEVPYKRQNIKDDLLRWQTHTYFITRAADINDFLARLDRSLSRHWKL